jgi:hypothetical protein
MPHSPANERAPGKPRTSRIARLVAVVAIVVVGGLAVGAASRPHRVDVAPSLPDPGGLTALLLVLLAAVAGLLVGRNFVAAWAREPDLVDPNRKKSKVPRVLQVLLPILLLAVVAYVRMLADRQNGDRISPALNDTTPITVNTTPATGGDLGLLAVCVLIGLGAALAAARLFRTRTRPLEAPAPAEGPAAILDEGLGALLAEADPRRAVIAAYVAMERAMARQGWARRPAEAPSEYLSRVLGVAPTRAADLDRLVGMYQLARFSEHEVTASMRETAVATVRRLRADLQGAA